MRLSKVIPERRKTVNFLWCKKDFMKNGVYNAHRKSGGMTTTDRCWWCNYKFLENDMMALASPEKQSNQLICQNCAKELLAQPQGRTHRREL